MMRMAISLRLATRMLRIFFIVISALRAAVQVWGIVRFLVAA